MKNAASRIVLLSRREAVERLLAGLGGAAALVACGGSSTPTVTPSSGADAGTGAEGGGSRGGWASGGTKSMTGSYADPFPTTAAACVLAFASTEGPCTETADRVRKDISEGYGGLPMRLALRVVDGACKPIAGAKVKIWHTQIAGSYSGDTPNPAMCVKTANDAAAHYFRGVQTTNENGRVDFDSCFPGWYRGRTIHVHFTVSVGQKTFSSQLAFDQALITEIFSAHDEYKGYGLPDTTNATDGILKGDLASVMLAVTRMPDGAMMAAKQLMVNLA